MGDYGSAPPFSLPKARKGKAFAIIIVYLLCFSQSQLCKLKALGTNYLTGSITSAYFLPRRSGFSGAIILLTLGVALPKVESRLFLRV